MRIVFASAWPNLAIKDTKRTMVEGEPSLFSPRWPRILRGARHGRGPQTTTANVLHMHIRRANVSISVIPVLLPNKQHYIFGCTTTYYSYTFCIYSRKGKFMAQFYTNNNNNNTIGNLFEITGANAIEYLYRYLI